jgi:PadR family transcriptional regulator, regulatory protein PadR
MDRARRKGNLDLLLSVLSARPAHGYAIIAALRDRGAGPSGLPEGTIYPALHRLLRRQRRDQAGTFGPVLGQG